MTSEVIEGIIFDWVGTLHERDKGLFPHAREVVNELRERGYHLGLVSIAKDEAARDKRYEEILSSGVKGVFDVIIVDTTKTPGHYQRCMKEMGTIPRTTAIVDDRMVRGIKIGNQLGCRTFWVQQGEYAHERPNKETGDPHVIIDSVEDLLRHV